MVVLLGDTHLSSAKPYFREISERMVEWIKTWEFNSPEHDLVLLGDLVDSAVNGGLVMKYLDEMITSLKFRSVHIVKGNHDYKKVDGVEQLAYEYLKSARFHNVHIYEELTEATIGGLRFLLMPYYSRTTDEPSMVDTYSNVWRTHKGPYDVVVGHFADEKFPFGSDTVQNVEKINTTHICLGHIHTRVDPRIYIGSMYPCNVSEGKTNRAAWIFDERGNRSEELLPEFARFSYVKYPEDLPESEALVNIYSIYGATEQVARSKYGDIYIRKTISSLEEKKAEDQEVEKISGFSDLNQKDLFREFVKSRGTPMDRRVFTKCLSLLPDTN